MLAKEMDMGGEPNVISKISETVTVHLSGNPRRNSSKKPSRILSSYLSSKCTTEEDDELPVVEGGETPQLSTMDDRWQYNGPNFLVDFSMGPYSADIERAEYGLSRTEARKVLDTSLGHCSGINQRGTIRNIFSGSMLSSYLNSRRSSEESIELSSYKKESTPPLTSLEDRWIYQEFSVYASTITCNDTPSLINEPSTSQALNRKNLKRPAGLGKSKSTEQYDDSADVHYAGNKPKSKRSAYSGSLLSSFLSSKSSEDNQSLPSVEGKTVPPFATLEDRWVYHGLNLLADVPTATISPRIAGRTKYGDEYVIRNVGKAILYVVTTPKDAPILGGRSRDGQKLTFGVATHSFMPSFDIHICENWPIFSGIPTVEGEVKLGPDMKLGAFSGDIDSDFRVKSTVGEGICNIKCLDMGCCSCYDRSYQVVVTSTPKDLGGIVYSDSKLFITFPTSLDIPGRAMVLACSIIIQYQIEEAVSGVYPNGE
ncbi:uncharacterized protein [Palaemon carinicauda]|uniref:uncharacterized protein n=1 Tax=Palaemon carinicauda TaxID=392227 RepID=UPI0035B5C63B